MSESVASRGARILAAVLALAAPAAGADWTPVAPDNGLYTAYADPSTIHRDGAVATMLGLYDFPRGDFTPEGFALFSTVVEREYDCGQRRVRLMRYADHEQRGGQGRVVSQSSSPRRWEPVVDESLDARYFRIACPPTR